MQNSEFIREVERAIDERESARFRELVEGVFRAACAGDEEAQRLVLEVIPSFVKLLRGAGIAVAAAH